MWVSSCRVSGVGAAVGWWRWVSSRPVPGGCVQEARPDRKATATTTTIVTATAADGHGPKLTIVTRIVMAFSVCGLFGRVKY